MASRSGMIFAMLPLLLVFLSSWRTAEACSCMPEHPQAQACRASFVVLGRILSRRPIKDPSVPHADYIGYKLKILDVLKNESLPALVNNRMFVTTPSEDSMCGLDLVIKQLYIFSGYVDNGRAHINICGFVKPWNQLSLVQKKGFRGAYYENCDCHVALVHGCEGADCYKPHAEGCAWNTMDWSDDRKDCQNRHAICTRDSQNGGMCSWQQNKYLQHCESKTRPQVPLPFFKHPPKYSRYHPRVADSNLSVRRDWP